MTEAATPPTRRRIKLHPVLVMITMVGAAVLFTHLIPAGRYERAEGRVVAGSYQTVPKVSGLPALFAPGVPHEAETPAKAAGVVAFFSAIPAGLTKTAGLMFMVMFVGGMFGVLQATGAVDAGIDRLLHVTAGNVYLLTGLLMLVVASGATFLGLYSEYLAIVPLVLALAQRLGWSNLFAVAIIVIAAAVGYSASVTNPIVLAVAQPLAHVPIFSGLAPRLIIFIAMFVTALAFMMLRLRKLPRNTFVPEPSELTRRQVAVLISLALGTVALVVGTSLWGWATAEHAALFVAWALLLAAAGGIRPGPTADAFLDGMKFMVLPSVMIGLAGSIAIILQSSQVLDSVVHGLAVAVEGRPRGVVASGILVGEMALDVLINSTSAKAAVSLPILTPVAQLAGIGGNVSVSALTMAGSLTNMITPTNGFLLAFLAAGKVDYGDWAKFVLPLFLVLCVMAFVALQLMVAAGVQ